MADRLGALRAATLLGSPARDTLASMRRMLTVPALGLCLSAPLSCSSSADGLGHFSQPVDDEPMIWPTANRPLGAPCAFDTQCSTHRCSADVEAGTCGACVTAEPLGDACGGPRQGCSVSAVCVDGRCQSLKKGEGELCALGPKGYDIGECDVDLACAYLGSLEVGLCLRRARLGESCADAPAGCVGGAFCNQDGVCAPRDCLHGWACGGNTYCVSDGRCLPGTLPEGAECSIDGSDACVAGLVCERMDLPEGVFNRCAPPPVQGEPCSREECAQGLFCYRPMAGLAGTCDAPRGEGEACRNDFYQRIACADGLECRGGTCKVPCE
jgi:hypothetical protein